MQKLHNAVDSVRLSELHKARREGNEELIELINCKQRFILLKKRINLTENQTGYLEKLCKINEPIYKAMLLKESFLEIYTKNTIEEAEVCLNEWIEEAGGSSLDIFKELSKSFTDKKQYILNWFKKRISSSISEGFNKKAAVCL